MSPNLRPFLWSRPKARAAQLLAEDELTDEEIGQAVGICRRQLARWKRNPAFHARVADIRRHLAAYSLDIAIPKRRRRIAELNKRWLSGLRIIRERAADPRAAQAPGGSTGLLARRVKVIGSGANAHELEEWRYDAALMRDLLAMERQAAEEGAPLEALAEQYGAEQADSLASRTHYLATNLDPDELAILTNAARQIAALRAAKGATASQVADVIEGRTEPSSAAFLPEPGSPEC
jgi:hypothetical protein